MLLVGMMGAGKSTVANLLAARLGWPLVDTDAMVESRAGATVAEVFDRDGEAVFRAAEAQAIVELEQVEEPLDRERGGRSRTQRGEPLAMRAAGTVVWLRALPSDSGGQGREREEPSPPAPRWPYARRRPWSSSPLSARPTTRTPLTSPSTWTTFLPAKPLTW